MTDRYTFGGKYRLEQEIANGGCGTVFLGVHTVAGKEVAIKLEPATQSPKQANTPSPLKQESRIYKTLMGGQGVPWIMWSGRKGDYNVMVIDLLGPSLEDLFKMCNRHFSIETVLLLADQLISRIAFIHCRDLVHRDIKPANFVMGTGKSSHIVNVIDFGLAKKFRNPRTGAHIPYRQDSVHGVGTSLFASINTHMGIESSRRDDLESLAYMLIYFLRGTLPWRKIRYQPPPLVPIPIPSPPIPSPESEYSPPSIPSSSFIHSPPSISSPLTTPQSPSPRNHPSYPKPQRPQHPSPIPPSFRKRAVHPHPSRSVPNPAHPSKDQPNPVTATWNLILQSKLASESTLTRGLPAEFDVLYRYARSLAFDDLPDYEGLRAMFRKLGREIGVVYEDDGETSDDDSDRSVSASSGRGKGKPWAFDWTIGCGTGSSHVRRRSTGKVRGKDLNEGGRRCEACEAKEQ